MSIGYEEFASRVPRAEGCDNEDLARDLQRDRVGRHGNYEKFSVPFRESFAPVRSDGSPRRRPIRSLREPRRARVWPTPPGASCARRGPSSSRSADPAPGAAAAPSSPGWPDIFDLIAAAFSELDSSSLISSAGATRGGSAGRVWASAGAAASQTAPATKRLRMTVRPMRRAPSRGIARARAQIVRRRGKTFSRVVAPLAARLRCGSRHAPHGAGKEPHGGAR